MATYAIGDIQGCFAEFKQLLAKINYQPDQDQLWLAGDLINRGPNSLDVLRFCRDLQPAPIITLGNHDIHLLALAANVTQPSQTDTLNACLQADDSKELCQWLRQQKLFHYDTRLQCAMVHAGIPPQWDLATTIAMSKQAQRALQADNYHKLLATIYQQSIYQWQANLTVLKRNAAIINYFTCLRFCTVDGVMDFNEKRGLGRQAVGYEAWFAWPQRHLRKTTILFGHWAALQGKVSALNVVALDYGCVWGNKLAAYCIERDEFYFVDSKQSA